MVNKSLVVVEHHGETARYRLLETVRQYAAERLAESGEGGAMRQCYGEWYLALAEQAAPKLEGPEQVAWATQLDLEHDNLRAALAGGGETQVRLALALWKYWVQRGHCAEGRRWIDAALAGGANLRPTWRAWLLTRATLLAAEQSAFADAQTHGTAALALWRELGDGAGAAWALIYLGLVAQRQGEYATAECLLEEAATLARAADDRRAVGEALNILALIARARGDGEAARSRFEEMLAIVREAGDQGAVAVLLANLGNVAMDQGDRAAARRRYQQSLAVWRTLGERPPGMRWTLLSLGTLALAQGDTGQARAWLEEGLLLGRTLGDRRLVAAGLIALGWLALHEGDAAGAERYAHDGLALARELGTQDLLAASIELLGVVAGGRGEAGWAVRLCSAAAALRASIGAPPSAELDLRAQQERTLATARARLGEKAYAAAWVAGQEAPVEILLDEMLAARDERRTTDETPPPSVRSSPAPNGLTAREVEVLRLLASGHSNREIAAELVVSVRTAEHHIESIYAKIGAHRRADAVAYALRRGLLPPESPGP